MLLASYLLLRARHLNIELWAEIVRLSFQEIETEPYGELAAMKPKLS